MIWKIIYWLQYDMEEYILVNIISYWYIGVELLVVDLVEIKVLLAEFNRRSGRN